MEGQASQQYLDEEEEAKSMKRGIWTGTLTPPWDWPTTVTPIQEIEMARSVRTVPVFHDSSTEIQQFLQTASLTRIKSRIALHQTIERYLIDAVDCWPVMLCSDEMGSPLREIVVALGKTHETLTRLRSGLTNRPKGGDPS